MMYRDLLDLIKITKRLVNSLGKSKLCEPTKH